MSLHRVHIVMPTYNQAELLEEAIESILNQTYRDWQMVIVNDGSTDCTKGIIKDHPDKRIVPLHYEKNRGTSNALNTGFITADCTYETWVSSDNVYYPEFLEEFVKFLDMYPEIGFAYSDFRYIGRVQRDIKVPEYIKLALLNEYYLGPSFMWRHVHRMRACPKFPGIQTQDYYFALKMSDECEFKRLPKFLMDYRVHDNQAGAAHWFKKAQESRELYLKEKHGGTE